MNFNPDINTIYCDLDGVLADFDAYKVKHLSKEAQHDDDLMWSEISKIEGFYRKLDALPYARKLWTAIKQCGTDRAVLTAIPRKSTMPSAADDKRLWCMHNRNSVFGGESVRVLIGPHSKDKWRHASEGDILIDDRTDNIAQWVEAGGIGIYHNGDVDRTIRMLHTATNLI